MSSLVEISTRSVDLEADVSRFDSVSLERTGKTFAELLRSFPVQSVPDLARQATEILGVSCSPENVRWTAQSQGIPILSARERKGHRGRGRLQGLAVKYLRHYLQRYQYPSDYAHAVFLLSYCGIDLWPFTGTVAIKEHLPAAARGNFYTTLSRDVTLERWLLGLSVQVNLGVLDKMSEMTQQARECSQGKTVQDIVPLDRAAQLIVYGDGSGCLERSHQDLNAMRFEKPERVVTHLRGRKVVLEKEMRRINTLLGDINP